MLPTLPIPNPLRGAEPGTFAHRTITRRMPEIGRRTIAEGNFEPEITARLEALVNDLPNGQIRLLDDPAAPDLDAWHMYIKPYEGQTWLEAPWFFVETYFYRRILEASGFFQPGPWQGADPYAYQKGQGLLQARLALEPFEDELSPEALKRPVGLDRLLHLDLWGNQADLSMWPAGGEKGAPGGGKDEHLLRDDIPIIVEHIHNHPGRLDIILDNTGAELAFDFMLVDGLLRSGPVTEVHLWAKSHPTFVSDATVEDVRQALEDLVAHGGPGVSSMAGRLSGCLAESRLQVRHDYYWTSPLAGWEMPGQMREELSKASLVLSKGDANYRRWLGDRHWAYDAPVEAILSYSPAPIGLLRVLKSEVAAGIPEDTLSRMLHLDPGWMTNGKWGIVQFIK